MNLHLRILVACCLCILCPVLVMAGGVPATQLDPVVITGEQPLQDETRSATEGYVTAEQLAERPISRPGELLEFVPGLTATQHSGEGKANQYFLRGFNLDHGTDFYSEVDGLPVNMRTHAHGQGYADINFIIPELIGSMEYRKGPYYADVGDFAAAGSANLRYVDELPHSLAKVTVGESGYYDGLLAASPKLGDGHLLLGITGTLYRGPFDLDENEKKIAALARYNEGDNRQGFTASLALYGINYTAPDQIPLRAVHSGQIDRLGYIDPTDGGRVRRYSLNAEWRGEADRSNWRVQGYALRYQMDLYSDFTYFLNDPVNGDQFNQYDDRYVYGVNARRYWRLPTVMPMDLEVGLQSRYDDIRTVSLYLTKARQRLSTVREDGVGEFSLSPYLSSTQKWTNYFRSQIGLRTDTYFFDVTSNLAANSGRDSATLASPKLALIFGPWQQTEFYLNYGYGFHSNDARGVTLTVDPSSGAPADKVPALVRAKGGEIGVTTALIPDVKLSLSLFQLDLDSELVFVGDAGGSEPSGASHRKGFEVSAYYTPLEWLIVDGDVSFPHARLDSSSGDRIPNALENVVSFGVTVPDFNGWSGGLRLRHLGPAPLIEDNSARSSSTTIVNAQAGYRFLKAYTASLSVLNLFDSRDNDITYFYESQLKGEPAPISDIHFHPVEPRTVRLTLGAEF